MHSQPQKIYSQQFKRHDYGASFKFFPASNNSYA